MDGFKVIRSIGSFMVEHSELIMTIAKVWLGSKIAGGVGGMAQGMFRAVEGGITGFTKSLGSATAGLAALYVALDALANHMVDAAQKERQVNANRGLFREYASTTYRGMPGQGTDTDIKRLYNYAKDVGAIQGNDPASLKVNQAKLREALGLPVLEAEAKLGVGGKDVEREIKSTEAAIARLNELVQQNAAWLMPAKLPDLMMEKWSKEGNQDPGMKPQLPNGEMNVHIDKIEVASPDPDRFMIDLEDVFGRARRNPSQAASTIRGMGK
jgi:hypothetical protein